MSTIFTRGKAFRSVRPAGHSCSWQSRRPFQRFIRQCQLLHSRWPLCCLTDVACPLRVSGCASGQPECSVGYAEHSRQIGSVPKDHRTRAASMPQPFQTAVFAASSEQAMYRSLPHRAKAYSFRCSSSPTCNRFAGLQVGLENGDGDAVPYAVLILNRQFHKQRQRAE